MQITKKISITIATTKNQIQNLYIKNKIKNANSN